jgi:hypothetical protein
MEICHHKKTGVGFLQTDIVAHGPKIVAQMQVSGWSDTAHDYSSLTHDGANIE